MTQDEKKDFYNECMDCRMISYGSLEGDDIDEFYRLIDDYADKKLKAFAKDLITMIKSKNRYSRYNLSFSEEELIKMIHELKG